VADGLCKNDNDPGRRATNGVVGCDPELDEKLRVWPWRSGSSSAYRLSSVSSLLVAGYKATLSVDKNVWRSLMSDSRPL
jgi:hypothetical protein